MVGAWANSMATTVNNYSGLGGTIEVRLSGDNRQVSSLGAAHRDDAVRAG